MTDFKDNKGIKYCGNCGKKLIENAVFCAYCGFSLEIGKPVGGQNRKSADLTIPTNDQDYSITHQEPVVPYTPYHIERIQPRPFLDNFKGALVSPKTDLPLIASKPNLSQPRQLRYLDTLRRLPILPESGGTHSPGTSRLSPWGQNRPA